MVTGKKRGRPPGPSKRERGLEERALKAESAVRTFHERALAAEKRLAALEDDGTAVAQMRSNYNRMESELNAVRAQLKHAKDSANNARLKLAIANDIVQTMWRAIMDRSSPDVMSLREYQNYFNRR